MKILLILSLLLFLSSCSATIQLPPNIIIILADDLGYGDISPYNAAVDYTPNIQSLANDGILFTAFYAPVSVCTPTRSALLTGRYPVRDNLIRVIMPDETRGINGKVKTLPEALRERGYSTSLIGKWHLGASQKHNPLNHGFDYYFGMPYGQDTRQPEIWRDREMVESWPDLRTLTGQWTDEAIGFIEAAQPPFYLQINHTQPHVPLFSANEGATGHGLYADAISEIDASLGQILAVIETKGIAGNTIVIFTSDNGPYQPSNIELDNDLPIVKWSVHEPWMRDGTYLAIYPEAIEPERWTGGGLTNDLVMLRQPEYEILPEQRHLVESTGKYSVYEGGLRVPLIIRWPGRPAIIIDNPVIMMDLYPTLIEATGGIAPPNDGESLLGLLNGGERAGDAFHFYRPNGEYNAIRWRAWKLHFGADFEPVALYHVATDSAESNNLINQYTGIRLYLTWMAREFDQEARSKWLYLPSIFVSPVK